jgi:XamI restriction endonuclease
MSLANFSNTPIVWNDFELETEAQRALEEFVDRRLAEPGEKYVAHVVARKNAILRLFRSLAAVDPLNPDVDAVRNVLLDDELFDALRYVAGPPVSEDDIGVLVTRNIKGLSKSDIKKNADIPTGVLKLVCRLADPVRFPWIAKQRQPSARELRLAVTATAAMHAAQALQTERRSHGKVVELRFEGQLIEMGFRKISGPASRTKADSASLPSFPKRGVISQPSHHPAFPYFFGECVVYKRKVDLFIALPSGKMIALEAKDSSSGLNSKKRLLNDTAGKAGQYLAAAGNNIISVALLSGVFNVSDLRAAQDAGLYLVWAHDVGQFIEWIKAQTV